MANDLHRWAIGLGLVATLAVRAVTAAPVPAPDDLRDDVVRRLDRVAGAAAPTAEPGADGLYMIDLLVLHTPLAAERMGGARNVRAEAARLVGAANGYFANSDMPVRYRMVGFEAFAGSRTDDYRADHEALAQSRKVARWRDATGADVVVLLRTNEATAFCGLGSLFNNGEQSDPPANVDPERDAFSIVGLAPDANGASCPDVEHLFAHELGHTMGGGHQYVPSGVTTGGDPPVKPRGSYWKPYAHATACIGADGTQLYSLMTGNMRVEGHYQVGQPRADFFSSPALVMAGYACGYDSVHGSETAEADNARSITEAAPYIAAYRQAQAHKSAGSAGGALGAWLLLVLSSIRACAAAPRSARRPGRCSPRAVRPW